MSGSNRELWKTATTLDQSFLDQCADNLSCAIEMVCEIELPGGGTIYASDRNKYVGERFYEALLKFPSIQRTIGEWLSNETEFSTLTLALSNVDGRFNPYLPSGASYGGWIGKRVIVRIGLRDVDSTYRTIFKGKITDIGGFGRTTQTITIIARDDNQILETNFPQIAFDKTAFPHLENDKEGLLIPFILGDWTTNVSVAPVPAIVVNGNDPDVYDGARNHIKCRISINDLSYIDTNSLYLKRGSDLYKFDPSDIKNIAPNFVSFEIDQNATTLIDGSPYLFDTGDEFFLKVIGPPLSGYRDNIVSQAKHIIDTYLPGAVTFDTSWTDYRDKSTPTQSAISAIKSRVWIQEPQSILSYVKSLLGQVRLETFWNAQLELAITSNHFEDWQDAPSFSVRNWDVEKDSFQTAIDEKNVFNRAQAAYSFEPVVQENTRLTSFWKNTASITQVGRTISKQIVFPNLYVQADVENQLIEILRLAIAVPENVTTNLTWRAMLLDLADFVQLDVRIGPSMFSNVPCKIRSIGYEPDGLKIPVRLTSFQMFPFKTWNPGYSGIVGGQSATIVQE